MRSALASMLNRAARLRATSAHRGGRRFEGLVDGQDSQRSTSRSAAVDRRRTAALFAVVRLSKRRSCIVCCAAGGAARLGGHASGAARRAVVADRDRRIIDRLEAGESTRAAARGEDPGPPTCTADSLAGC